MTADPRQAAAHAPPLGPDGLRLEDGPARRFLAACWVWGLASMALAALASWSLVHPELADGRPALGFGRLRPLAELLLLLGGPFSPCVHGGRVGLRKQQSGQA